MRFHRHRDPNWQLVGCWRYYECKCGARRIARGYANMVGPSSRNWPEARDRHGQCHDISAWEYGFTGPIEMEIPINWNPPTAGLQLGDESYG